MRKRAAAWIMAVIVAVSTMTVPQGTAQAAGSQTEGPAESRQVRAVEGDYEYYSEENGTVAITEYRGNESSIVVPDTIEGMKVTTIGYKTFRDNTVVTDITIPNAVTEIGAGAFEGCTALREFRVNAGSSNFSVRDGMLLEKGEDGSFSALLAYPAAKGDEEVVIPWEITEIKGGAFSQCVNIKKLTIPGKVTKFGVSALDHCQALEELVLESGESVYGYSSTVNHCDNVKIVKADRYMYCFSTDEFPNLEEYHFGKNYNETVDRYYLGNYVKAFYVDDENPILQVKDGVLFDKSGSVLIAYPGKSTQESFSVPETVTEIRRNAFLKAGNLRSILLPETLTKIGDYAFSDTGIEEITFAFNQSCSIDSGCVDNCSELKLVRFGKGIEDANLQLLGCPNIESIYLSASVKEISADYWRDLPKLQHIEADENNEVYCTEEDILYTKNKRELIFVPRLKELGTFYLPKTVQIIRPSAFQENKTLTALICGLGLSEIGNNAFENCENLKELSFTESLKKIGDRAFYSWEDTALSKAEIPKSVEFIGEQAFNKCAIYGEKGSEAERYANDNDLVFVDIDEEPVNYRFSDSADSEWDGSASEAIRPEGNVYTVSNAAQMQWLSEQSAAGEKFTGKRIVLTANIDMAGYNWTPIGVKYPFQGSFDGNEKTIANLTPDPSIQETGLFSVVEAPAGKETYIKDLTLMGVRIENAVSHAGGVAAKIRTGEGGGAKFICKNVSVSGTMSGNFLGGIAAQIENARKNGEIRIENCKVTCDMEGPGGSWGGSTPIGGIVNNLMMGYGYDSSSTIETKTIIRDCTYTGKLKGRGRWDSIGGIVRNIDQNEGAGQAEIEGCVTNGSISAGNAGYAGGIIATAAEDEENIKIHIYGCVNKAQVTGAYYAGGIAANVGASMLIEECCNEGYIMGGQAGCPFGGISATIGSKGKVKNCLNTGEIGAGSITYEGGITGENSGEISNCYTIGRLPQCNRTGTNFTGPGAMASMSSGDNARILSSYFDIDNLPLNYLLGTDFYYEPTNGVDRSVGSSPDGAIVHSGGLTAAQFQDPANLQGWDFTNVWTYDADISDVYPVPYSIRDKMTRQPNTGANDSADRKKDSFYLTVMDFDGNTVAGAEVTLNGTKKLTNKHGAVQFSYDLLPGNLSVKHDDYTSYNINNFKLSEDTGEYKIYLRNKNNLKEYDLKSVLMDYNGGYYELLTQIRQINLLNRDTSFTIACAPADSSEKILRYELYQGNTKIAESENGKFSLKTGDFEAKSGADNSVYVQIIKEDGQVGSKTYVNLRVIYVEDKSFKDITIGKVLKFRVGESAQILKNEEFDFGLGSLPVTMTVTEDKWKIGVNIAKAKMTETDDMDFAWYVKNATKNMSSGLTDYLQYLEIPTLSLGKNPKVSLSLMGYAEGNIPSNKKVKLTLTGVMKIEGEYEKQVESLFVVGCDLEGKVQTSGNIVFDTENVKWKADKIVFNLGAEMAAYAGWGMANSASVNIYGRGTLNANYIISPEELSGPERIYVTGDLGMMVRWQDKKEYIPLVKDGADLYNRDTSVARAISEEEIEKQIRDKSNYTSVTRDEYTDRSQWMLQTSLTRAISGVTEKVIQSNAYSSLSPQIFICEEDTVMIFTDDGDSARDEADKSMLMYSLYDESNKSWSSPRAIADDGTADMMPTAVSDGTNSWVVWSNAKTSLKDITEINEIAKNTEVWAAKYDSKTHSFAKAQQITDNQWYESGLTAALENGTLVIGWTINSEEDVWRLSGTNDTYYTRLDGSTMTEKIRTTGDGIEKDALGILGNQMCYAAITNTADHVLTVCSLDGGTEQVLAESGARDVWFTEIDGKNQILWVERNGNLYSQAELFGEKNLLMEGFAGNIRDILQDEKGNLAVLYTKNGQECADAYALYYDAAKNVWSKECELITGKNYVEQVTGTYREGALLLVYNNRTFDAASEDHDSKNHLLMRVIDTEQAFIRVENVEFNPYRVQAGEDLTLTLTVKNQGNSICENGRVEIRNGDTEAAAVNLSEALLPGQEKTIEVSLPVPPAFEKTEYTVQAEDLDRENVWADAKTFTVGEAKLSMSTKLYCVEGKYSIAATVNNDGYDEISGHLLVYNAENEADVYARYRISGLQAQERMNFTCDLSNLIDNYGSKNVGIRVETDEEIQVMDDCDQTLMVYQDEMVKALSISLDQESIRFDNPGETRLLHAEVLPENTSEDVVSYSSSNPYVAAVSEDGLVTAKGTGTARIYASAGDGDLWAVCRVTVNEKVTIEGISISESTLNMKQGDIHQLTAELEPFYAHADTIKWSSSDETVATVSDKGMVMAYQAGTAQITVEAEGKKAVCQVTVTEYGGQIAVDSVEKLTTGGSYENDMDKTWVYVSEDMSGMTVTFSQDTNVEDGFDYIYIYDEEDNQIGSYTGGELSGATVYVPGSVLKIKLTSDGGITSTGFKVDKIEQAHPVACERVTLNRDSVELYEHDEFRIEAEVTPQEALIYHDAKWISSDTWVASVDQSGCVTALEEGEADITVSVGDVQATCHVKVTKKVKNPIHAVNISQLQSAHPYENYEDQSWIYTLTGSGKLSVVFSEDTATEEGFDYIYIYDRNDNLIGSYSGNELSGKTVEVPGDTVKIRLTSDGSNGDYGFSVERIVNDKGSTGGNTPDDGGKNPGNPGNQQTQKPYVKLNAVSIPLKVKQTTKAVKITDKLPGDTVISWSSSNRKVAAVSGSGKITGKKAGTAVITVTMRSGAAAKLKVKVQKKKVTTKKISIARKKVTLKKGKSINLNAMLNPITSVEKISYSSSNKKVAAVSSKGIIKAKKPGTAKITVKSGKKKVTCKVKVKK